MISALSRIKEQLDTALTSFVSTQEEKLELLQSPTTESHDRLESLGPEAERQSGLIHDLLGQIQKISDQFKKLDEPDGITQETTQTDKELRVVPKPSLVRKSSSDREFEQQVKFPNPVDSYPLKVITNPSLSQPQPQRLAFAPDLKVTTNLHLTDSPIETPIHNFARNITTPKQDGSLQFQGQQPFLPRKRSLSHNFAFDRATVTERTHSFRRDYTSDLSSSPTQQIYSIPTDHPETLQTPKVVVVEKTSDGALEPSHSFRPRSTLGPMGVTSSIPLRTPGTPSISPSRIRGPDDVDTNDCPPQ